MYKRQIQTPDEAIFNEYSSDMVVYNGYENGQAPLVLYDVCLLYTSDAADERSSVDLGGRRIIKKKKRNDNGGCRYIRVQRNDTKHTICEVKI